MSNAVEKVKNVREKDIQSGIFLEVSKKLPLVRLFRNNVGKAFYGKKAYSANFGEILTKLHRVTYGLLAGSSDIIGWKTVEITPEMVGRKVAVFVSLEVKRPGKNPTECQQRWLDVVNASGGIAARVDSPEQAVEVLNGLS